MASEEDEKLLSYFLVGEMEEERKNEKHWEMVVKELDELFDEKKNCGKKKKIGPKLGLK